MASMPDESIERKILRQDLFYRIGVVQLRLPPLRERMSDILPLTLHFVNTHSANLGIEPPLLAPEVMAAFFSYDFPGNVRELEHIIEASLNILNGASCITIEHIKKTYSGLSKQIKNMQHTTINDISEIHFNNIPQTIRGSNFNVVPKFIDKLDNQNTGQTNVDHTYSIFEKRKGLEIEDMQYALTKAGGRITTAAKLLGLSSQFLHYKLKKYGIDPKRFIPKRLI